MPAHQRFLHGIALRSSSVAGCARRVGGMTTTTALAPSRSQRRAHAPAPEVLACTEVATGGTIE